MENQEFASRFEEWRIWQSAGSRAEELYRLFERESPAAHHCGFRDPSRQAAFSVMKNTAEGFKRGCQAEFARFPKIARSCCGEVCPILYPAEDFGYLAPTNGGGRRRFAGGLSGGIAFLLRSLHPETP